MFGLGQAVRSTATAITASIESTSRTAVAGLSIVESWATVRATKEAHLAREDNYWSGVHQEMETQAKALGYASVDDHMEAVDKFRSRYRK